MDATQKLINDFIVSDARHNASFDETMSALRIMVLTYVTSNTRTHTEALAAAEAFCGQTMMMIKLSANAPVARKP